MSWRGEKHQGTHCYKFCVLKPSEREGRNVREFPSPGLPLPVKKI
jgi:hypothetical protein